MATSRKWIAAAVVVCGLAAPAWAQQGPAAQQASAGAWEAARCGGLFCAMYYAQLPAGEPVPAPGQPGSIFLPCHDFVCGMFGGRTAEQSVAVAAEPTPVEPAAKPKRKHAVKRAAKESAADGTKSARADEPAPK